jgi:L-arabinokinase
MYASHWSYGQLAMLGCEETDLLVRLLREAGPEQGVLGAKITGGGCGGTVAVMSTRQPEEYRTAVLSPYEARTGIRPEIVQGSSPGAVEWGVRVLSEI